MNKKVMVLRGDEPEKILRTAVNKRIVAIMSYLSKSKWHVAKVLLTEFTGDRIGIVSAAPKKKQHPLNIQPDQPVGISFKYEYGKFVFDTTVVALEASSGPGADQGWGGSIILAVPDRIEVVQRRSYFRVNVPESLKVKVVLRNRSEAAIRALEALGLRILQRTDDYAIARIPVAALAKLAESEHVERIEPA